ncbi:MAG TPA: hypothetical protein VFP12_11590 [Allosphingosinicella sp.]|nr:hypothetical protein [Allosphingosinicella sp.]
MHPIAFLALLTIALLALAAFRLELDFRRTAQAGPEPLRPGREEPSPRPELRASPAGGYCQSPWSAAASRRG